MSRIWLMIIILLFAGASAHALDPRIAQDFERAVDRGDLNGMRRIVEENLNDIPPVIEALVEEALLPGTSKEDREASFYVAERMASEYKEVTGDFGFLKKVKRASFESQLHSPVRSTPEDGVHTVEAMSTEEVKNIFRPDNIVIKKGETVRWVNNDTVSHLLASMPVIGMKGLFSPSINPGEEWAYTFEEPGEYYYICFIHKLMHGKVTVTEQAFFQTVEAGLRPLCQRGRGVFL